MMRSIRVLHLVSASVFVGLLGCSAVGLSQGENEKTYPTSDTSNESKAHLEDVIFKFDKRGNLVPITEEGKPYETCYERGRNVCRIFNDKVKISKLKSTTIIQVQYDVNPENCRYIKIIENGIETNLVHPADRKKDC